MGKHLFDPGAGGGGDVTPPCHDRAMRHGIGTAPAAPPLDTNARSWSHHGMANVRSIVDSASRDVVEHAISGGEGRTSTRACSDHRPMASDQVRLGGHRSVGGPHALRPTRAGRVAHRHLVPAEPAPCRRPCAQARRRRLGLAAVAAVVLGLLAAPIWGHPTALGIRPPGGVTRTVTVAPGDTLVSIARRAEPGSDTATVVVELRAELAGAPLAPGMRLRVP